MCFTWDWTSRTPTATSSPATHLSWCIPAVECLVLVWHSLQCLLRQGLHFIVKVTQDLECGHLPAHPFPPPPAEAARELFSPFLMHPRCLRTGGTTPAQLPVLPVSWAELQFGIQFGIAARLILSTEVFAWNQAWRVFSPHKWGEFFCLTFYQRRLYHSGFHSF